MLELTVTLRDREIKLKPDHKAIFQIEDETGLAVYDLLVEHTFKTKEMACILYHCAKSAKEEITKDEMGALLIGRIGLDVVLVCNKLLNTVFGTEVSGDSKKKSSEKMP